MTNKEFVGVYRAMVRIEIGSCKPSVDNQEYHERRIVAFWIADSMVDLSRKELAEMVMCNDFTPVENNEDVETVLEYEFSNAEDNSEEQEKLVKEWYRHIKEYFEGEVQIDFSTSPL